MRYVYEHPEEAAEKGRVARQVIQSKFTPKHAAVAAEKALTDIC